ncbi:hypothetical protein [Inhella proteolytica]|uniref:Uncharacterized protein n=1 Tax=Inhella proteolytica TaxID=2795029 RepID=A0A931J4B8_9BURK|nr:hypothetical protein [Inhella proteolytica]MBH9577289.1 hypothetical protein [Inhella proteolytica]
MRPILAVSPFRPLGGLALWAAIAAATAAPTARYDLGTGRLSLGGLALTGAVQPACFDVELITHTPDPLVVELESAAPVACPATPSATFDVPTGTLQIARVSLTGGAQTVCYTATLNTRSTAPLRLALSAATPLACNPPEPTTRRFKGEVWADNWFALYLGETLVAEDSVPITTERSFNAETFQFEASYPLELNFVLKDYKQNDSGLEYIGAPNQQIGDGGMIMQITDLQTGKVVAVSSSAMRCTVLHKAPLNPSCEKDRNPSSTCLFRNLPEPAGWKSPDLDLSGWEAATVYSAAEVGPKEGYFGVTWDPTARFIWTSDLRLDNTLLCKLRVPG